MTKKNSKPAPTAENSPAPCPAFNAVLLPENFGDEAPDGYPVALVSFGNDDDRPMVEFTARLAITARIRPHDLVRVNGKWLLEFSILSPDTAPDAPASGPLFGVEVGGADLSFEDAARLLCGA